MSVDSVELQPAYILHHRAWRDTSALLELITPGYGRIGVVARGARSARSPLRGLLRPFLPLLCSWGGRGELFSLRRMEVAGRSPELRGQALFAAYYLNELLLRLLQRQDPHPEVFDAYVQALGSFALQPLEAVLRVFEKRLLEALGYALVLESDVSGEPIEARCRYRYLPEQGLERMQGQGGISGRALLALAAEACDNAQDLREIKPLLRQVLGQYLGERPLKTREFLIDLEGQGRSGHD
ncbi:DNA repair protein RecO [Thiohalobacter sp. COW1]|uniref:DNA repair protein RecO n=1 Tax=Thiohalobacter sp. COW1 TaxID=2795687 RepID=UPI00191530EA|nr:DNA repair protein RecO [Thiohalobacter sp. COW1]BCO31487.1 DNA repair protein RecO [Thiohalobacter sp. COW1]